MLDSDKAQPSGCHCLLYREPVDLKKKDHQCEGKSVLIVNEQSYIKFEFQLNVQASLSSARSYGDVGQNDLQEPD